MLKIASASQIKKAIDQCEAIITDEWDPTKIAKQLMVSSVDASKIHKPDYLTKLKESNN